MRALENGRVKGTPHPVASQEAVAAAAHPRMRVSHRVEPLLAPGPARTGVLLAAPAYWTRCAAGANQVRDNMRSTDLNSAVGLFLLSPRLGEVYKMGCGRESNCSMLEAISLCERLTGRPFAWSYDDTARIGDHIWYISDLNRFKSHFPEWKLTHSVEGIVEQIYDVNRDRWSATV